MNSAAEQDSPQPSLLLRILGARVVSWCQGVTVCPRYGLTVTVACMLGWILQVIENVPAVGNVIVIESPGEKLIPTDVANCEGAPEAAANWPFVPVTST